MLTLEQEICQLCRLSLGDRVLGEKVSDHFLETYVSEATTVPSGLQSEKRIALHRKLLAVWRAAVTGGEPADREFERLLGGAPALPSEGMLAMIMFDIMQFPRGDIAAILAPAAEPVAGLVEAGRAELPRTVTGSVLIIEDEALIASDMEQLLVAMGAGPVEIALTDCEAESMIDDLRPDLILADYNLECKMTGVEVVTKSKDLHDCPVIFVSGFPDQVLDDCHEQPDVVLSKPFSLDTLRAAIGRCTTPRYRQSVAAHS